jgi:LacI family transcriptional regulator
MEPAKLRGKVTIRTVAEDAGVSVAAVSKVLRNAYGVSEALKQNVLASIERLGYRPSVAARSMRGRTYTIGILLTEMENPFVPQIVSGVKSILAPANYNAMISVGEGELMLETQLIETMIDFRMDGLVLVAPRMSGERLEEYARQIPMAVIGHHEPTAKALDTVNGDDVLGARLATRVLIEKGHRDIHMISLQHRQNSDLDVFVQREIGYRAAMAEAGLAERAKIWFAREPVGEMQHDLRDIVRMAELATAFFCWSDLHGVPLLDVLRQQGRRVPEDVAVIGYDNSPVAALPAIALSSIDQQGHGLGEVAANLVMSRIEGRTEPRHILLEPHLVMRSST